MRSATASQCGGNHWTLCSSNGRRALAPSMWERISIADLLWEGERVVGASIVTPDGPRHVHARIVIGADGRHSFVARAVAAPAEEAAPALRALYYQYMRSFTGPDGLKPDGAEFSQRRNAHAREGYHRTITLARDLRHLKRNLN